MGMTTVTKSAIVITIPDQPPRCYEFQGDQIQLGRSENNHIRLDEQAVSNTHCEFFRDSRFPQWKFRDFGSTNGSVYNGQKVEWEPFPLNNGDEIILGNVIKLLFVTIHDVDIPVNLDGDDDPEVNPVAAAVVRQSKEDLEGTQLIRVKAGYREG